MFSKLKWSEETYARINMVKLCQINQFFAENIKTCFNKTFIPSFSKMMSNRVLLIVGMSLINTDTSICICVMSNNINICTHTILAQVCIFCILAPVLHTYLCIYGIPISFQHLRTACQPSVQFIFYTLV